ncbi:N-acetylglucosamine-6-phosphate deacetylase [Paenochrobactrum pullorum]|uniref:N-acetylglucosamine-6-phosphate deacetylase n=1 Tax=Paenochrobactrum pullorum TaxID=1324351 RepID=UPI0035BC6C67
MNAYSLKGARIFDGERLANHKAVIVRDGRIEAIVAENEIDENLPQINLDGGILAPGFIDAQVNGGGGIMLNDAPTAENMRIMAKAHRQFGTTSMLPTLITDVQEKSFRAIEAAITLANDDAGIVGLHLEGPHIAPARKGVHLPKFMRPLSDDDVAAMVEAANHIDALLVTMAAEQVSVTQVEKLSANGVIVCLGHTDATAEAATKLFDAGARGVTHLFNAMSQLGSRAPGVVGAALDHPSVWGGIIPDGHHIDPMSLRVAIRAKHANMGEGKLFFVTDAMGLVGSDKDSFDLHGRIVRRSVGEGLPKLTLDDGTIAGSDLDMASAVRFGVERLDLSLATSLAMATSYPARFLRLNDRGYVRAGLRADLVHLDDQLQVRRTWIAGV